MNILVIDSATTGPDSVSRALTAELAEALAAAHPHATIRRRDIGAVPVPHLTNETYKGIRAEPDGDAAEDARTLSDMLIAEVQDADVLVIGAPMYNFGIPSTLKAWFDHILRPRVTFRYTENGPEGLLGGRKAIVVETRGGFYSEGPMNVFDAQEPHLKAMLGFAGITDVTFVHAEGLGISPEHREQALAAARALFDDIANSTAKIAA